MIFFYYYFDLFLAYLDPEDERLLEEDLNTPTDSKRWDFEKHLYIFCIFHFLRLCSAGVFSLWKMNKSEISLQI